jgi:AcrR family transcriptional regulator
MPPKDSTAATRTALLDAARAEFAAHGVAGARVDRIAERAGVSKERIYGHFGSKEKLFDEVINKALNEMTDVVAMPDDDPAEYVGKIYDYYTSHPDLIRLVMWEALHYRDRELEGQEGRLAKCGRKVESLSSSLGREPSREMARTMLTLISTAMWPAMMPRMSRTFLGDEATSDEGHKRMREHLVAFVTAALRPS